MDSDPDRACEHLDFFPRAPTPGHPLNSVLSLPARRCVVSDASAVATRDASPRGERDGSRAAGETRRVCAWCSGPIPTSARRDSVCCSVRCRQARHRFVRTVGRGRAVAQDLPLRLAYADPPYPGNSRLYRDHPDYAGEVDHAALIVRLATYDGGWNVGYFCHDHVNEHWTARRRAWQLVLDLLGDAIEAVRRG